MSFQNRQQAGRLLANKLIEYQDKDNLIVLAIPRGGLVIGKELVQILHCPLDLIITKKIGAPGNPELAIGAVGPFDSAQGKPVIDEELAKRVGADETYLKAQIDKIKTEVKRQEDIYRQGKEPLLLNNKTVIIADDGVATGATMAAAVEIIRQQDPQKIIVAVPVIAREALGKIEKKADEVIYLEAPELFFALSQYYEQFEQITDEEVKELLK